MSQALADSAREEPRYLDDSFEFLRLDSGFDGDASHIEKVGGQEHDRREIDLLENRISDLVVVAVSVIEGDLHAAALRTAQPKHSSRRDQCAFGANRPSGDH